MDVKNFINLSEPRRSGSVGAVEGEPTSNAGTYALLVLLGVGLGVVGTVMVQPMLEKKLAAPYSQPKALPPAATPSGFRPGWYVLLYDRVSDRKHYHGKGRLKELEGPFMDKENAETGARKAREGGWSKEANGRAVVKKLAKSPW